MKITKHGRTKIQRVWIGKCNSCECEAEAIEFELKNISDPEFEAPYAYEKCPECGEGGNAMSTLKGMLFRLKKES